MPPLAYRMPGMPNIQRAFDAPFMPAPLKFTSQQCEDHFFHRYFLAHEQQSQRRRRTYLELGANNGVDMSNTHAFYTHLGWRGLLVEATPSLCRILGHRRPNDVVVCAAVCDASFGGNLSFTTSARGTAIGHSVEMGTAATWSDKALAA